MASLVEEAWSLMFELLISSQDKASGTMFNRLGLCLTSRRNRNRYSELRRCLGLKRTHDVVVHKV